MGGFICGCLEKSRVDYCIRLAPTSCVSWPHFLCEGNFPVTLSWNTCLMSGKCSQNVTTFGFLWKKRKEKERPTDQNSRAKESEWEVCVCLSGCLTLFVCLFLFLDRCDSSPSPSGNILCTDWRVLLMSWQQAQLTHVHLGRLGDTHTLTHWG